MTRSSRYKRNLRLEDILDANSIIQAREKHQWSHCGHISVLCQSKLIGKRIKVFSRSRVPINLNIPHSVSINKQMLYKDYRVIPRQNLQILYFQPETEGAVNRFNQLYDALYGEELIACVDFSGDRILAFIPITEELIKYYRLDRVVDDRKFIGALIHLTESDVPLQPTDPNFYSNDPKLQEKGKASLIRLISQSSISEENMKILFQILHQNAERDSKQLELKTDQQGTPQLTVPKSNSLVLPGLTTNAKSPVFPGDASRNVSTPLSNHPYTPLAQPTQSPFIHHDAHYPHPSPQIQPKVMSYDHHPQNQHQHPHHQHPRQQPIHPHQHPNHQHPHQQPIHQPPLHQHPQQQPPHLHPHQQHQQHQTHPPHQPPPHQHPPHQQPHQQHPHQQHHQPPQGHFQPQQHHQPMHRLPPRDYHDQRNNSSLPYSQHHQYKRRRDDYVHHHQPPMKKHKKYGSNYDNH